MISLQHCSHQSFPPLAALLLRKRLASAPRRLAASARRSTTLKWLCVDGCHSQTWPMILKRSQDSKTNDEKYLLKLWSFCNFVCLVLNIFLRRWYLNLESSLQAEQSTRGWRLSSNLHSSTWIMFLLSWTLIVDTIISPHENPRKTHTPSAPQPGPSLENGKEQRKVLLFAQVLDVVMLICSLFNHLWYPKTSRLHCYKKSYAYPLVGWCFSENPKMNAIIWVQMYPTAKLAEDDMRPRTIAFFIQHLSWQVLALAGQETSNHIVQSLIELLPQGPGLNLY